MVNTIIVEPTINLLEDEEEEIDGRKVAKMIEMISTIIQFLQLIFF